MNATIETLLKRVEDDPLPAAHTSLYWQTYGRRTRVERGPNGLMLEPAGFETVTRLDSPMKLLHRIERLSYRSVTARYRSFSWVWPMAITLARDLSSDPNFNVFKSACALAVLADHWTARGVSPTTVVVIGDGHGFFGALIRRYLPGSRLYCIDLPKMLVFQARLHEQADPDAVLGIAGPLGSAGTADVTFVQPQDIALIPGPIDCAVNMASMQEMTRSSIAMYFRWLRQRSGPQSHFYCVNRLRKELPGGEIIRFADYPWQADDEVFLDGPCPYYTYFFAPYTLPNGPRVWSLRIPFINYFDGPHLHRLVRLAPTT
jgi:hypothetical protein